MLLAQSFQIPWTGSDGKDVPTVISGPLAQGTSLGSILSDAITLVFVFAGIGLFLMLISGGFTFLTSAGDTKKLEQGRQQLTNALIGFIIIFVSFWLVQAFGIIFGVHIFKTIFG